MKIKKNYSYDFIIIVPYYIKNLNLDHKSLCETFNNFSNLYSF